ncbi:hypothetical protein [Mycolicibacterium rhodesiae]|uniref:hypothetical protein n=1 Tax=Mycolicibacterium rhodesiae TaxID=36814 RepID=UPI0020A69120|nr:hypothetical protein [Mycolicibacterium rhodesiae]
MAVTISVTKGGDDDGPTPTGETFGLASADDKGPANIITEDPSCAAWTPIAQTFIDKERAAGWNERDPSVGASAWTSEQRSMYETVARAARDAADQTVAIAKVTPHRVIREMYEQYIAYARAYSDAIPNYEPSDDHLARVFSSTGSAIAHACSAIRYGSAESRSPLVPSAAEPSESAPLQNPSIPTQFMTSADPKCQDWVRRLDQFAAATKDWQDLDPSISASGWTADQRKVVDAVIPVMNTLADDIQAMGEASDNLVFRDFAVFAAQYRRAYATALPSYTVADSYLSGVASSTTSAIWEACKAAGS